MCGYTGVLRYLWFKELIVMHSSTGEHDGDLKTDIVTVIGAALDLLLKVVRQVSFTAVICPYDFHPLTTARPGDDLD